LRVSVITFPGSNCDHDAWQVFHERGHAARMVWHRDTDLGNPDLVVLPGGFSYGDYLRCGALARFSPIVNEVMKHAQQGGLVMGICNGFQILTEMGLLPGTLMMNQSLSFICKHQHIRVEHENSPFSKGVPAGTVLDVPIAHKEGNYFIDIDGLKRLEEDGLVLFRYCDRNGMDNAASNPNGSLHSIAGIINEGHNVLGMMPHPERAATDTVTSQDGRRIFEALESFLG